MTSYRMPLLTLAVVVAGLLVAVPVAEAAKCGSTGGGYSAWKTAFAEEAKAKGVGAKGISALLGTKYATATIHADRNLHSFKLSLKAFMAKRGVPAIVARARGVKKSNAALLAGIEKRFGVPAGPLLAIWGMETAFGGFSGNQNTLSAVASLAYDCRRPEFFTDQLYAALKLVDRGVLSGSSRGAMHGELGQTQFLPKNVLAFGVDGDGNGSVNLNSKADALASTANFLKGHGWQRGGGYQQGEPNFSAIEGWNAAVVYQQAIAYMGGRIDGK